VERQEIIGKRTLKEATLLAFHICTLYYVTVGGACRLRLSKSKELSSWRKASSMAIPVLGGTNFWEK
jgi:hypothetical protein